MKYFSRTKLLKSNDTELKEMLSANLLNNSENILQYILELFRRKPSFFPVKKHDDHELCIGFFSVMTAIELLLKARVARIDYKLLYSNPSSYNRQSLVSGKFHSIDFEQCFSILENSGNVSLDDSIKVEMLKLRDARNKILHFYLEVSHEEMLCFIATALNFYIDFYRFYLFADYDHYNRTEDFEIELSDFSQLVTYRIEKNKAKRGIPNTTKLYECPKCYARSIYKEQNNSSCLFCCYSEIDNDL